MTRKSDESYGKKKYVGAAASQALIITLAVYLIPLSHTVAALGRVPPKKIASFLSDYDHT